jgi:hypothetical protein
VVYYLRRDPSSSRVAEVDGKVVVCSATCAPASSGREPSGWIERFGIDPDFRGAISASR